MASYLIAQSFRLHQDAKSPSVASQYTRIIRIMSSKSLGSALRNEAKRPLNAIPADQDLPTRARSPVGGSTHPCDAGGIVISSNAVSRGTSGTGHLRSMATMRPTAVSPAVSRRRKAVRGLITSRCQISDLQPESPSGTL